MSTMNNLIIEALESSLTMREACKKVNMPFQSFKRKVIKLGLYKPNQSGKGTYKSTILLSDVFANEVRMSSNVLKKRLFREGYKQEICEECSCTNQWNNKKLTLELDHINGNSKDNSLENLRILCPNCHSQTPTFRNRRRE